MALGAIGLETTRNTDSKACFRDKLHAVCRSRTNLHSNQPASTETVNLSTMACLVITKPTVRLLPQTTHTHTHTDQALLQPAYSELPTLKEKFIHNDGDFVLLVVRAGHKPVAVHILCPFKPPQLSHSAESCIEQRCRAQHGKLLLDFRSRCVCSHAMCKAPPFA